MATMLDCKKIQPLLSEYVDSALPGDTAWDVKLHLSSCAVCSRVAEELSATANMLSSLPRLDTSAGFEEALARRLAEQALQPRPAGWKERLRGWWETPRVRPTMATATAAVACALIPVVAVVTFNTKNTPPPTPVTAVAVKQQQTVQATTALEQFADEHAAYASFEPLADSAGLLIASSGHAETEPEKGF